MKRFKKLLVSTDTRLDSHPVLDVAVEIASDHRANITIVDVVPDLSWAARLSLQDHEHVRKLMRDEKLQKLESLAAPIRGTGVEIETKLLEGKTSVEIIRETLRAEHDLVMAVTKGNQSRHRGYFGNTARRLLRHCPAALWLVAPHAAPDVKHALACVDTSSDNPMDAELNDRVYELTSSIGQLHHSQFSVVHAWVMQDEALLSNRLSAQAVAEYVNKDRVYREKLMDKFLRQHDSDRSDGNVHLIKGNTFEVIPKFVRENAVDLVVMGTVARSGLTGMLMGNTAESILDQIECSVLALKPHSFKCSVH